MKTLEPRFTKTISGAMAYRVQYDMLERERNVAIYRRTAPSWTDYETIRIREAKEGEMKVIKDGKEETVEFEAKERYPSTESWGTDGFTFQTKDGAEGKMAELLTAPVAGKDSNQ